MKGVTFGLVAMLLLGCGGASERTHVAGAGGSPDNAGERCPEGQLRCDPSGYQELCEKGGDWKSTGAACTTNVAVDDETDGVCATKADGRYRCFTPAPLAPLPAAEYRRVQATPQGPIGLTRDGRLLAAGIDLPAELPLAVEFNSTNMWGSQGVCYRTASDGPLFVFTSFENPELRETRTFDGPFRQARCAWEGIVTGVLLNGTFWDQHLGLPAPSTVVLTQVAFGLGILCALGEDGSVSCGKSFAREDECAVPGADFTGNCQSIAGIPASFSFPGGPYVQIAATRRVGCALSGQGELSCLRRDGQVVATSPGRYTFIEAGLSTLCAIRTDGSAGCWRHDGDESAPAPYRDITHFDDLALGLDADW